MASHLKSIPTQEAVGHVLCHDITQIIKDQSKGVRFKKGHIVQEEDIPILLSIGKDNLYIYENDGSFYHENEGAKMLCDLCENEYMDKSDIKEGKIELRATTSGLFKVDSTTLKKVNSLGEMMIATRHGNTVVHKGDVLAGMRIIPLLIEKEKMLPIQDMKGPILEIKPFQKKKVAIFATGNEVFYGRIQDTFTPVVISKVGEYGAEVIHTECVGDDPEILTKKILEQIEKGANFVLCTGGMSVDPDDKTPLAIKNTGANIISYGSPVLPGAMLLVSYLNNVPILGLPGCVMYAKRTVFDLVLPRLMTDDPITKDDLASLGEGGLCLNCPVCTYPNCGFGKG